MSSYLEIAGMSGLREKTLGDPRVRVAVLDGPADLTHPCFQGAEVERISSYWLDDRPVEPDFAEHATHVMSVLFGQRAGGIEGIAPGCHGLNIAVGYDLDTLLSPLNLSRGIDLAFREGANIIHVGVCIPSSSGHVDGMLVSSIQRCLNNNILVISPAGNDKGQNWCVPASVPGVLAVGRSMRRDALLNSATGVGFIKNRESWLWGTRSLASRRTGRHPHIGEHPASTHRDGDRRPADEPTVLARWSGQRTINPRSFSQEQQAMPIT